MKPEFRIKRAEGGVRLQLTHEGEGLAVVLNDQELLNLCTTLLVLGPGRNGYLLSGIVDNGQVRHVWKEGG